MSLQIIQVKLTCKVLIYCHFYEWLKYLQFANRKVKSLSSSEVSNIC